MTDKPRLLVLSHVLPFPGNSGQQQRVRHSLRALRGGFHVTFATFGNEVDEAALAEHCDEAVVLASRYRRNRVWHKFAGRLFRMRTGLKFSNYVVGEIEFAPARVASLLEGRTFDCALFEYFHASSSAAVLRARGIPCVLDMHNVLWQAFGRDHSARAVARYARREEAAWQRFDGLITINREEDRYVRERVRDDQRVWYTPMGVDLSRWSYAPDRATPPRVAYYGGMSSSHNRRDALTCANTIMPRVWEEFADAELWIVGNKPSDELRALQRDPRIHVTGFVEDVASVLRTASALLCPWSGTYGFRSRLVEAMALGVPVVTTPDAVHGMGLEAGRGLFLETTDAGMAGRCMDLLQDPEKLAQQGEQARAQVESLFGFEATYGRLADELLAFTRERSASR